MAHKRKDILWKSIIEEFPNDFFRFFYKDADQLLSASITFEYMDKELDQIAPDWEHMQDAKTVDKLMKCIPLDIMQWLLLLVEIQGYEDHGFTDRLFKCFSRLIDKYGKRVIVLVIYTDNNPNYAPIDSNYQLSTTTNHFQFQTYKILDQNEQQLAEDNNIFALIVLTVLLSIQHQQNGTDKTLLAAKIRLLKNLKSRNLPPNQEAKVLTFIRLYIGFVNPQMNLKFEEEIDLIIDKKKNMGIIEYAINEAREEGIEQGIEKGIEQGIEQGIEKGKWENQITTAKKLLQKGTLPLEDIADITDISLDKIKAIIMNN